MVKIIAAAGCAVYTAGMQALVQAVAAHIAPVAYGIAVAGVAAAVCFQRPERRFAARVLFAALCALLAVLGCAVAGVLAPPPAWAGAVQMLLVALLGAVCSKCGWRRVVVSLGCWAFVTFMLWMCLRALPCDAAALSYARDKLLPAAALPCVLALLLSVRSPVRFWTAFMGVFLVLYLMESAGMAWESANPHVVLPGRERLVQQLVLGGTELTLCVLMFRFVLQCSWPRTCGIAALYSFRTLYVVAALCLAS